MFIIYSISLSSYTKFLFYVYFMLTVAPGGNNLATICYKDFLGLATINMYYYYYYYYYTDLKKSLFFIARLKKKSGLLPGYLHHLWTLTISLYMDKVSNFIKINESLGSFGTEMSSRTRI